MSGPLIVCTTCARELHVPDLILADIRAKGLADQTINDLLASDQQQLLGNKVFEMMEDLKLIDCCRACLTQHRDLSPLIYG